MKVSMINLGKKYEGRENFTIRDINLEIEDRAFCVILGPSGCGKSTLLRMVAGLNSITEGELYFGDRLVNKVEPKDRDIAMVFQSYALYPHMTVYDNIAFSLKMRKERKQVIHHRVLEAAKVLQLEEYLYSKPSDISGGQRQRVALGRAMVRKPQVFLMDEPLSNLDAKLREQMRIELVRLHKRLETTSIYVTHDQAEAMTMADRIVLLDQGNIQQNGTPSDLYNRPANLFVAKFIGSPTINVFRGTIQTGQFVSDSGQVRIRLNDRDQEATRNHDGKAVYVGIRSERFLPETSLRDGEDAITATIDVIENLGKEQSLVVKLPDNTELVMTMPGHLHFGVDEAHAFGIDPHALHLFDGETEVRLN
ncbi:MAG TPA: sn-glycerol-3-phosphate ABC transporter ATP-binding protein UgpC [Clostridiaceae bacterium]|jgi:multiple sugar transport system ATP-binding protein|nr:sn-glycerol-3-phosphate ABC transporter ATP-binding protein UgpC [Clostridiaceae bacterium]